MRYRPIHRHVKKDLILKHKLFPSLKTKEDYVLWLKISKRGIIFYGIKKVLTNWTDRKKFFIKIFNPKT